MKEGVEEAEEQRSAEDDAVLAGIRMSDRGDDAGVEDAVHQGGEGEDEAD